MGGIKHKIGGFSALKTAAAVFLLIGLLLLAMCIALAVYDSVLKRKCDTTEAEVLGLMNYINVEGSHGKRVVATYVYGGEYCPFVMPAYLSFFIKGGQTVEIYVAPDDPKSAYLKIGVGACVPLGIFGAICTAIGVILCKRSGADLKRRLVVKGRGEPVYATVTSLGDTGKLIKGKPTYRIKATWEDLGGTKHDYKSDYLYFDPSLYIENGALIRVYVDPKNYRKYYMCAKELQEQTKGK